LRRLVLVGAVAAALALAGCSDGYVKVDTIDRADAFFIYDEGGNSIDLGMATRACSSVGQVVDEVEDLGLDAEAIVVCTEND
jgi:hypothetical protein